ETCGIHPFAAVTLRYPHGGGGKSAFVFPIRPRLPSSYSCPQPPGVVHSISTFLRLCLMSILLQHNSGRSSLLFVNYFFAKTTFSRFTNSRSLSSPQALALETLWIFSIVSRCNAFEGKGRKMPRMEIQIVRQATRRTHRLAIPRPHRLWHADRCNGFQQRPGYKGHTDPPLHRLCCPRPQQLHSSV